MLEAGHTTVSGPPGERVKTSKDSDAVGLIADDDVRRSLAAIVVSPAFHASPQLAAFLRFVVESTLTGRSDRIKGYTIAVEALGRDDKFDPQTDPIVRVEAGRLRRALERYYAGPGADDPILIELPRGSYVPSFRRRARTPPAERGRMLRGLVAAFKPQAAIYFAVLTGISAYALLDLLVIEHLLDRKEPAALASAPPAARPAERRLYVGPSLFIAPIATLGEPPHTAILPTTLESRMRDIFARFDDVTIISNAPAAPAGAGPASFADYRLATEMDYHADGTLNLRFQLRDEADGSIVWARTFERAQSGHEAQASRYPIVREIAGVLLQPFGVIHSRERIKRAANRDRDPRYACLLESFDYFRTYEHSQHARIRGCLEDVTRNDPTFASGFSSLARAYFREYLFGLSGDLDARPLDRALETAQQAIALKPNHVRAYYVLLDIHMARGEVSEALAAGEKAIALNPYDTTAIFHYAAQLVLLGEIDKGLKLISDTVRYVGSTPPRFLFIQAIAAYLRNDFSGAAAAANQLTNERFPLGYVLRAITQLNLGDRARARKSVARLVALYPSWQTDTRDELNKYLPLPWVVDRVENDLREAGLDGAATATVAAIAGTPASAAAPATALPTVMVDPIEILGTRPTENGEPSWIRAQLVRAFQRFEDVNIVTGPAPALPSRASAPDYHFTTTASFEAGGINLTFRLIDKPDGTVLWTKTYERVRHQAARGEAPLPFLGEVAVALLHPIGVVPTRERIKDSARAGAERYRCMLTATDYLRSFVPSRHAKARGCLEEAVAADPSFSGGFVALARVYLREHQFSATARPGDSPPLERAAAAAQRAIAVNPNSARAHFVLFDIAAARGDERAVRLHGEKAMALNPYDSSVVFHYGAQLIMLGDIDAGLALVHRVSTSTTVPPARLDFVLFMASYLKGDMAEASRYAKRIANDAFVPGHVARALAAYRSDGPEATRKAIERLAAIDPSWRDDPRGELAKFIPSPSVVELFARDLALAGLGAPQRASHTLQGYGLVQ